MTLEVAKISSRVRSNACDQEACLTSEAHLKTFRVRGIPRAIKRSEVENIIETALGIREDGQNFKVYPIAYNPYRQDDEKVATVSFALSSNKGKDEWQFPLTTFKPQQNLDEKEEQEVPRGEAGLVVDTHFKGFTPMRSFRNAADHDIEYILFLFHTRVHLTCIVV